MKSLQQKSVQCWADFLMDKYFVLSGLFLAHVFQAVESDGGQNDNAFKDEL